MSVQGPGTFARDVLPPTNAEEHAEPASIEESRREYAEIVGKIQHIEAQLGSTPKFADREWRRRAIDARRHYSARLAYLREWQLKHNGATSPRHINTFAETSTTELAKTVANRIGQLEAVYRATIAYIEDDTDASWNNLLDIANRARQFFGDEST